MTTEARSAKADIRGRMVRLRAGLAPEARAKANQAIYRHVLADWKTAWKTLLIYVNLPEEAGTIPIIREMLKRGRRVCVPAFDRQAKRYQIAAIKDSKLEELFNAYLKTSSSADFLKWLGYLLTTAKDTLTK